MPPLLHKDDRTLGEMFVELSRETGTLVHQEIQLATAELTEKASTMFKSSGMVIGGGLLAYGGLLAIIAAMILALIETGLSAWAAAMIGGIAVAGAGYLLIRSGLATMRQLELRPGQTIEGLKEDAQWLKAQVK